MGNYESYLSPATSANIEKFYDELKESAQNDNTGINLNDYNFAHENPLLTPDQQQHVCRQISKRAKVQFGLNELVDTVLDALEASQAKAPYDLSELNPGPGHRLIYKP